MERSDSIGMSSSSPSPWGLKELCKIGGGKIGGAREMLAFSRGNEKKGRLGIWWLWRREVSAGVGRGEMVIRLILYEKNSIKKKLSLQKM